MAQSTNTVQFLIIGKNKKDEDFNERVNAHFLPTATESDFAQKREDLKTLYESRGYKSVSVYTVSPHLQMPIA